MTNVCIVCHSTSYKHDPITDRYHWLLHNQPAPNTGPFCSRECLARFIAMTTDEQAVAIFGEDTGRAILRLRGLPHEEPMYHFFFTAMILYRPFARLMRPVDRIAHDPDAALRLNVGEMKHS